MVKIEVTNEQAQLLRKGPADGNPNDPWRLLFRSLKAMALQAYGFGGAAEWVDSEDRRVASAHLE